MRLLCVWLGLMVWAAGPLSAETVLSNLGTSNDVGPAFDLMIGQAITLGGTAISLTSVSFTAVQATDDGVFGIYSRNPDGSLGASLFSSFALSFDGVTNTATATVTGSYVLQASTGYWFVLSSGTGATWNVAASVVYSASYGISLPATRTALTGAGTSVAYYDLSDGPQLIAINGVVAVPEPSTSAMVLMSGLIALAHFWRKCRLTS